LIVGGERRARVKRRIPEREAARRQRLRGVGIVRPQQRDQVAAPARDPTQVERDGPEEKESEERQEDESEEVKPAKAMHARALYVKRKT
jgi:hypothetical protein